MVAKTCPFGSLGRAARANGRGFGCLGRTVKAKVRVFSRPGRMGSTDAYPFGLLGRPVKPKTRVFTLPGRTGQPNGRVGAMPVYPKLANGRVAGGLVRPGHAFENRRQHASKQTQRRLMVRAQQDRKSVVRERV